MNNQRIEAGPELVQSRTEKARDYILSSLEQRFSSPETTKLLAGLRGKVEDLTEEEKKAVDFFQKFLEAISRAESNPDASEQGPGLSFGYLESKVDFHREVLHMFNIIEGILDGGAKLEDSVFGGADRAKGDYYRELIAPLEGVTFAIGCSAIHESDPAGKETKTEYSHFIRATVYGKDAWQRELPKIQEGIKNNAKLNEPVKW